MSGRVIAAVVVLACAGCGSQTVVTEGSTPVASPYDGPMSLPVAHDHPDVQRRGGAATRAVECTYPVSNGGSGDYDSGLASAQDAPEAALADWFEEEGSWYSGLPGEGYREERRDDDRVLFSYDVDGLTKAAVIVADGMRDWKDATGWGVESWAHCDLAELPPAFAEAEGTQVWLDLDGERVPTTEVVSHRGPEHCDWQDIVFLQLGGHRSGRQYLRDTHGELADLLLTSYHPRVWLPAEAEDTGWHREGRALWTTPEAAYLVALGDPSDVERWPATREPVACA